MGVGGGGRRRVGLVRAGSLIEGDRVPKMFDAEIIPPSWEYQMPVTSSRLPARQSFAPRS